MDPIAGLVVFDSAFFDKKNEQSGGPLVRFYEVNQDCLETLHPEREGRDIRS